MEALVAVFIALRSLKKKFVNKNLFGGKPKLFLLNTFEKGSVSPIDNLHKKDNVKLYIVLIIKLLFGLQYKITPSLYSER